MGVTADIAGWIATDGDPSTPRAVRAASHALLDWGGVALAGATDPLVDVLVRDALDEEGDGPCTVPGRAERLTAGAAARVMGAASHALDFDDINTRMRGHSSVTVLPALLADGDGDLIDALVAGTEVACVLGEMMGASHYERGFHTTATVGTVAAAAGVCRKHGLDAGTTAHALSLAATQSSGLRVMFGTMAKPLHAGLAAERGLRAARWAMAGMTAPADGIESPQGFGPVLSDKFAPCPVRPDRKAPFGIEENVFKQHAACYYTHSAIEAVRDLSRDADLAADDITAVRIGLQPALLTVCDIVEPSTGVEVKFSVRHLAAMAILGCDTTNPDIFKDPLATDPEIVSLRQRIVAEPLSTENRMEAHVRIERNGAPPLETRSDVSAPATDLDAQETALTAKFTRLAAPVLGQKADDAARALLSAKSALTVLDALTVES